MSGSLGSVKKIGPFPAVECQVPKDFQVGPERELAGTEGESAFKLAGVRLDDRDGIERAVPGAPAALLDGIFCSRRSESGEFPGSLVCPEPLLPPVELSGHSSDGPSRPSHTGGIHSFLAPFPPWERLHWHPPGGHKLSDPPRRSQEPVMAGSRMNTHPGRCLPRRALAALIGAPRQRMPVAAAVKGVAVGFLGSAPARR